MKKRVLLLASFLIVGAGCGNKGGGDKQVVPPTANPLQIDQIEIGAQRLTASEFLRDRPQLNRIIRSSDLKLKEFDLKLRSRAFTLESRSFRAKVYEFGTLTKGYDRLFLDPNLGEVVPYRNAQGEICANIFLNASVSSYGAPVVRPAMTVTVCEENYNDRYDDDDYDREDRRDDRRDRRRRY